MAPELKLVQAHWRTLMIRTLKIMKKVYTNDHGASVISDGGTQCCVEYEDTTMNTNGQNEVVVLATTLEETTV